ncbi:MAG: ABC transporter permease [Fibrobacteria bacterium]|nr:ABC transporter permease [Fibrobacteria bacterium]
MKRHILRLLPPAGSMVLFLVAWHLAVRWFSVPSYLVPSPGDVLVASWDARSDLVPATLATLAGAATGFALSLVAGTLGAILFSQARWIRDSLYPWAIFLQTVPIVAIAPLIVLWSGPGFASIVLVSFLLSVFPILSNGVEGMSRIDPSLLELFRLCRAARWQELLLLRLPHSVPFLVAGARVSAGLTVIGAIVGEFFAGYGASRPGLGYLVQMSAAQMKTELLFASVGASTFLGLLVFLAVGATSSLLLARLQTPPSHH